MSAEKPFTNEEIDELVNALERYREHLFKIYKKPGTANTDWLDRNHKLSELKKKLLGMRP